MELSLDAKRNIFSIGLAFVFLILLARFVHIQLALGDDYLRLSEKNRVRELELDPPRGLIKDRYGKILVDNQPTYAVYAVPYELTRRPASYKILAAALNTTKQDLQRQVDLKRRGNYVPVKIARHFDFASLSMLHERRLELPGVDFRTESRRSYIDEVRAPHLFGYLGEISDVELDALGEDYSPGDLTGKKGVEKQYEQILHGEKGRRFVEVDAFGRVIRELTAKDNPLFAYKKPIPGKDLILGIDSELQHTLEKRLAEVTGGAVVLNCKNGEVLALVSKPDYDLEMFSRPLSKDDWVELINDPVKPLYDRMVQSVYPPGSTFKIILVLAGLQSGTISPKETVHCPGYYVSGGRSFACWLATGHGTVNLESAIEQSCNVYFYRMGLRVGLERWAAYARKFGFGQRTGIDLTGESAGLVPDEEYFNRQYGPRGWNRGVMLNLAIGQGDLLVTPLQLAKLAMLVANEGHGFRPRLKRGTFDPLTFEESFDEPDSVTVEGIDISNYALLKAAMFKVVQGARGTAKAARVRGIVSAGKTGTAQNPHGEPHAWFIGFAPFEDPQIAYCILIENGGAGSSAAAPVARDIISLLLEQNKLIATPKRLDQAD